MTRHKQVTLIVLGVASGLGIALVVVAGHIIWLVVFLLIWIVWSLINLSWPYNLMLLDSVLAWILVTKQGLPRRHRNVLLVVATLGLVVLAGFFVHDLIYYRRVLDSVSAARGKADAAAERRLSGMRAALQSAGLVGDRLAVSKVDVCYVTDEEGGWFANNWYQGCYLRYVEGYSTTKSRDDVIAKAAVLAASYGELQTPWDLQSYPCKLFEAAYSETLRYRPAKAPVNANAGCGQPGQVADEPRTDDGRYSQMVKTYAGFDPASVSRAQNQIWIMLQTDDYYHEDLGCRVVFWCGNPRTEPIQAGTIINTVRRARSIARLDNSAYS